MGVEPRVSAVAAAGIVGLIGHYGGDPDRIIGAAKLELRDLGDPTASLDLSRYCDMFEQAARQTGVDDFGLRFGGLYQLETMGPLGELVLNSATLGGALQNLCRYFPAIQDHSTLALRNNGGLARLEYQIRDGRILHRRQDAELTIGIFNTIFQRCFGPTWAPTEIHFEHLRTAQRFTHQSILSAPTYFGQPTNAILFRHHLLSAPMPSADPAKIPALKYQLSQQAVGRGRPEDFIGQVVQAIRTGLKTGQASIDAISAQHGMSRAKLYRILASHNIDFTKLTEIVRRELAMIYITEPHIPLTEIAALLGYSELSAFSRAFKRWTAQSPASYRARPRY